MNTIEFKRPRLWTVFKSICKGDSITRSTQDAMLAGIKLSGEVVDLGARDGSSTYYRYIDASAARMTYCDYESKNPAVAKVDLEKPLPFEDGKFDTVLLMHVMEHIFGTRELLGEMYRITRGNILIAVPFLICYHPDHDDYFRFTHSALERLLKDAGFKKIRVVPWGHGLFTASLYLIERFIQIRPIVAMLYCITRGMDAVAAKVFSRRLAYQGALGYLCVAER